MGLNRGSRGVRLRRVPVFLTLAFALLVQSWAASASGETRPRASDSVPLSPPLPTYTTRGIPSPEPWDAPFGANVRVSEDDTLGSQNEITMAVASDGRIHMGWNDARLPEPDYRCGYSYSTDGGQTWSANRLFHISGWDASGDPVVLVDSNDAVYFVCMSFDRPPKPWASRIAVYRSVDGGANWSPGVNASDTTTGLNDKPWAFAVGTTIHLCYANFGVSPNELRYTRSADGGLIWAPTRILDRGGNGCVFASTAAGMLYVAWVRSTGVYVLSSSDAGTTWSAPRFVSSAPFTDAGDQRAGPLPAIAADWSGGNVYVVWSANDGRGTWDVRFSRSTDDGVTWSIPVSPSDDSNGRQFMPGIGVDANGLVHVSWYDTRTGLMTYRYASSSDGGQTWTPSVRVTNMEWPTQFFIGDYTTLAVDSLGYVYCGWADARSGEVEAYFATTAPGPPVLARIDVTPPEAWTDADTPFLFSANGYDQYGQPYPAIPTWEAEGGTISSGLYTPQRTGDWRVWANATSVSGSAVVHVSPGALVRIQVDPAGATVAADTTLQYAATGYDAKDNVVAFSPLWGVTDGSISAGLFAPRRMGLWTVYANASGVVGWTLVVVIPGALASIVVTPPVASITADETQQFAAAGFDARGNPVPIGPDWTASGGTIDGTGRYAAWFVGTWSVTAADGVVFGSAQVTVSPGALFRIEVSPSDTTITADDTQQYAASGYDAKGNAVPITPNWSVLAGSISASGLYTPAPTGTFVVTASVGLLSGSTTVTVVPGRLARIDVVPPTATISADDALQLTASGFDAKGNAVPTAPVWTATCGAVDASGLFTPAVVGLCVVYANETGVSGSATIAVFPGRLARIQVSPPVAAITADDTVPFTAAGYDAKGNVVSFVATWSVPEGAIDASGVYTPRRVGGWDVRAESGGIFGIATATVTPGLLAAIELDPPLASITADETVRFTATGSDAKGNEVLLTALLWSSENGSVADGEFLPWRVGTWNVFAAEAGIVGSAAVAIRPGAVAVVVVEPGSARLLEGELLAFDAEAFDAKGNPVPDAEIIWSVIGGVGTVDGAGVFRATRAGRGEITATATDGQASASASAPAQVDPAAGSYAVALAPWIVVVLVGLILVVLLVRRRKRETPPPSA